MCPSNRGKSNTTPLLQAGVEYLFTEKLSLGLGINYEFNNKLNDFNLDYEVNPISFDTVLSLYF